MARKWRIVLFGGLIGCLCCLFFIVALITAVWAVTHDAQFFAWLRRPNLGFVAQLILSWRQLALPLIHMGLGALNGSVGAWIGNAHSRRAWPCCVIPGFAAATFVAWAGASASRFDALSLVVVALLALQVYLAGRLGQRFGWHYSR
jgi:hypothetical protein